MKHLFKVVTVCAVTLSLTTSSLTYATELDLMEENTRQMTIVEQISEQQATGLERYTFTESSTAIDFNGKQLNSDEPFVISKGVSYIQFKTIAQLYGFRVSYNNKTKESIATSNTLTIAFKANSSVVKVNGKNVRAAGVVYTNNGHLMIPVRTWANLTDSSISSQKGTVTIERQTAPSAAFSVAEKRIVAGETTVTYIDNATSPSGYDIIEEEWTGKQEVFDTHGKHTVTRRVKDSRGVWSAPYQVTINVVKPNVAPRAAFLTDKTTYKIGEPVVYTNNSTDDGVIVRNTWTGNKPAFFEPGFYSIRLEVEDEYGLTSTASRGIRVIDEVMYTEEQFYYNFTPIGEKMPIDRNQALKIKAVPYSITPEDIAIVRTNSPELLIGQYVDYSDTISGPVRFNIHKKNGFDKPLELHLIVTNETDEVGYIQNDIFSHAGPATYVSSSGKAAAARYLSQLLHPTPSEAQIVMPGESISLFSNRALPPIKTLQTMSILAEYTSSIPLRYTLVVTEPGVDAIASMDTLIQSQLDMMHVRATFEHGSRTIKTDKVLGQDGPDRLIFGDTTHDILLKGIDAVTGDEVTNFGNGGVVYNLELDVAPHTAIIVNPRGGHYAGAFIVNDEVIQLTKNSILINPSEAGFLHRTGAEQEKVNISFVVAQGSNLPLNLLFMPLPELN